MRSFRRLFAIILFTLVVTGPNWLFQPATSLLHAAPVFAIDPESQRVVEITNQERAAQGLQPLAVNELLVNAAQAHSTDMATNNFMSHTGSDGSSPGERITRTGYRWRTYGENVAAGYSTPEAVMKGWMASSGHRANILNASFTEIGVAYARDPNSTYGIYWTMVLAAPSTPRPTASATARPTISPTRAATATVRPTISPTRAATATVRPTASSTPNIQVIFSDDFETNKGWTVNPQGSDTATIGRWERGDPEGTDYNGPKQLGNTSSGSNDLVTGRLAGSSPGAYDVDGGVTSIQSPDIILPRSGKLTLSLRYYLSHATNASSADYLRVLIVGGGPTRASQTSVFEKLGAASDVDASWQTATVNLSSYTGQTVRILIEAADVGTASLLEAAIDDVIVTAQ